MIEDTESDSQDAQADFFNAAPIYKARAAKEYLSCEQETVFQQDSRAVKTDWKKPLYFDNTYDQLWPQFGDMMARYAER